MELFGIEGTEESQYVFSGASKMVCACLVAVGAKGDMSFWKT